MAQDIYLRDQISYLFHVNYVSTNELHSNNHEHFQTNTTVCSVNRWDKQHPSGPIVNPSHFQKSPYYAGINIFNNLRSSLKSLMNKVAQLKVALKKYLNTHAFCSVDIFIVTKFFFCGVGRSP
jgi:hypothetical protein